MRDRKIKVLVVISVLLILGLLVIISFSTHKYPINYCETDSDCTFYCGSSCGSKLLAERYKNSICAWDDGIPFEKKRCLCINHKCKKVIVIPVEEWIKNKTA